MNTKPKLSELPFLRSLCWQTSTPSIAQLCDLEILQLYERNWRYQGVMALGEIERQFVQELACQYHSWLIEPMLNYSLHNQILEVLGSLRADFLEACHIYFGGGTLLTLCYGEYRLSRDIDFLCPYGADFSRLRVALYDRGIDALFDRTRLSEIELPQELKTDSYGVRFTLKLGEQIVKFKIIAEGRISLDAPSCPDWSPVPYLNIVDQVAEKLLANGDRWLDTSTDSRDLIDLAILKLRTPFPLAAIAKAEAAYRCIAPLQRAIQNFQLKPDYRGRCYERLGIQSPVDIIDGLDRLAIQFDLPLTPRMGIECKVAIDEV